ncbi:MAG: tetratricopeptide repeat protein [Chloroflexota bacterium]
MSSQDPAGSGWDYLDLVRSALKQWHNFTFLGEHDLTQMTSAHIIWQKAQYSDTLQGKGLALQHLLKKLIETLRPGHNDPDPHDRHWRAYIILTEHYLKQRTADYIADLLGISRRTYFAEQHKALERLAGLLQNHEYRIQIEQQQTAPERHLRSHGSSATESIPSRIVVPSPLTTFIGREQEIAELYTKLCDPTIRLLTLIGPPGIGKTRLAIQIAPLVQEHFSDGVWFVPLAPIHDPALVASTIAHTLRITIEPNKTIEELLQQALAGKRALLILDNFEHLIAATPFINTLLTTLRDLKILVTTRTALRLSGEHHYQVPKLPHPQTDSSMTKNQIITFASIQLFMQRTQTILPCFELTEQNQQDVAQLCTYLEGIPLAIELAASRGKIYTPEQLLHELTQKSALDILTHGTRDLLPHQQTLRVTMAWSYNLLEKPAQILLQRLAIFTGSWSLEAAEHICNPNELDQLSIAQGLETLVDHSLIQRHDADIDGAIRFSMLETIREYALEQLTHNTDSLFLYIEHASYFLEMAKTAKNASNTAQHLLWFNRLEQEHANLQAAIGWSFEHHHITTSIELVYTLATFWRVRSYSTIGRYWLEYAMQHRHKTSAATQSQLLEEFGFFLHMQSAFTSAYTVLQESLALRYHSEDQEGIARTLNYLGLVCRRQGRLAEAETHYHKSLAIFQALQDTSSVAGCLNNLGLIARDREDLSLAQTRYEQSLELFRKFDDLPHIAGLLLNLGNIALEQEHFTEADTYLQESLTLFQKSKNQRYMALVLYNLGWLRLKQGAICNAYDLMFESLLLQQTINNTDGVITALEGLAGVATVQQQNKTSAQLLGAMTALRNNTNIPFLKSYRRRYDEILTIARAQLPPHIWDEEWHNGCAMSLEQAILCARQIASDTT